MSDSAPAPGELSGLFDRIRGGDRAARNDLLTALYDRLVRLTGAILREFPVVQRRRTVESLANDLSVKLIAALDSGLSTRSTADFLRLAGLRLRQLLIDEADKFRRRAAAARELLPPADEPVLIHQDDAGAGSAVAYDRAAPESLDPATLAEWTEFHTRVGELPEDERQVVEMHFYAGVSQAEIAGLLGLEPKQVSRKWLAACARIGPYLPRLD